MSGEIFFVYGTPNRLRRRRCNRRSGFRIAVVDGRGRGDNSVQMRERIIVPRVRSVGS